MQRSRRRRAAPARAGSLVIGLLGLLALLAFSACQPPPTEVRNDVLAYLARTREWAPVEAEAAQTIERILRTEFVDEAEVNRQIADSRPRLVAHIDRARAYHPRSQPVESIHVRYVRAWETLLAAYDSIETGFSRGDYAKLADGREGMARWRAQIVAVASDLRELTQRFGVDPTSATAS